MKNGFIQSIIRRRYTNIGIDLGSYRTRMVLSEDGVVLDEPSMLVINEDTKEVLATGIQAKDMIGRTREGINIVRPIDRGIIVEFEETCVLLKSWFLKIKNENFRKLMKNANAIVSIPNGINEVQAGAVIESFQIAGFKNIHLIQSPILIVLGMGLNLDDVQTHVVIDFGAGYIDISVISLGGVYYYKRLNLGSFDIDKKIISFIKNKYSVLVSDNTAMKLKDSFLSEGKNYKIIQVSGRSMVTGLPIELSIKNVEIMESVQGIIEEVVLNTKRVIERLSPDMQDDILRSGVILVGGGANLLGLDKRLEKEVNVQIVKIDRPEYSIAYGLQRILSDTEYILKYDCVEDLL